MRDYSSNYTILTEASEYKFYDIGLLKWLSYDGECDKGNQKL